jgi:GMP synthase (glutamine-hydrolysing)
MTSKTVSSAAPVTAIALRHVAFEDLGLLAPILQAAGWAISYREAPIDDLDEFSIEQSDLLIVLGSPIGVYDTQAYPFLSKEITLLERRLGKGLPTLGICLGSQLMAKALGSRVFAGPVQEIGWGQIELTSAGRASCLSALGSDDALVLHWHGDTFDVPHGATGLAFNANYEKQAFSYGRNSLALQFHLEADPLQLEKWFVGHAVELAAARVSVPDLRAATAAAAGRVRQQAQTVFADWLRQISAAPSGVSQM